MVNQKNYTISQVLADIAGLRGILNRLHLSINAGGRLHCAAPDGANYTLGSLRATGPNNQAVSAVAGSPVSLTNLAVTLGLGSYKFRIVVYLKANANAGNWNLFMSFGGSATMNYAFQYTSAAGVIALTANQTIINATQTGPATSVLGFYKAEFEGKMNVTGTGIMAVDAFTSNVADTFNVFEASNMEFTPVS